MRQFLTRKLVSSPRERGAYSDGEDALARGASISRASRLSHQGLTGQNPRGFHDVVAKLEMIRRQHDDRRSVLEPPELIALADARVASKDGWPAACGIEHDIEKMQPDARNQDGRDRHQGKGFAALQAGA